MQTAPANWDTIFNATHKTEYKFNIDGVDYMSDHLQGNPKITKPLLDKPAVGRVCSTTIDVVIRPIAGVVIPKAARVYCYCRLISQDGQSTTDWVSQGSYYVSSRSGKSNITLSMRDDMVKAGQTYFDKTPIVNWPCSQQLVVDDIATLMGVEIDPRTSIRAGSSYRINYMDTGTLISEVLSAIAASNGGNWIMTEEGKLRLVKLASPKGVADQVIGANHGGYTDEGIDITISRVTMTDSGDNVFTAGTDTGFELTARNPFADQTVVDNLITSLAGVVYCPHRVDKARISPLLELGDTISVQKNDGTTILAVFDSAVIACNIAYSATVEAKAANDAEEEFPFQTSQELQSARSVRTDRTYYGTSLNKGSGLVIRRLQGDTEQARVTFNADEMAFYQGNEQVLFFDAAERQWRLSAAMDVQVENADGSYSNLNVLSQGLSAEIKDVNGRTLTVETTINGVTVTDPQTGQTLINGGSIYTDNLYLSRLFERNGGTDSYVEMLDNGLNFVLGQTESIGIGYYSAEVPLPYLVLGAGSTPKADDVGMVKKYPTGVWVGDSADRYKDEITNGTGIFINTVTRKIYKYNRGTGAELADTSQVIAVFG